MALEELPSRALAPGELRIAVHFAGVSFVDVLTATGGYQVKPATPFTPGSEFSGIVSEVGPDVAGFKVGDRVSAASFGGVFGEEAIVAATSASLTPPGLALAEAALIRTNYLTACYALKARAQVRLGETVLVLGAAGGVGVACIQVAVAYGAKVIASASSPAKRQAALACGAGHAIDSAASDWRDQIKALTAGRGVEVVVDPVGGDQTERAFRSLAWNGRHLVIGFAAGEIPRLPTNLALLKGASLMGVDLRQVAPNEPQLMQEMGAEVTRLAIAGVARPPIARIYPLDEFADAMREVASGSPAGRIVLKTPAADSSHQN
jgi:NADPH2:quinone reductase